MIIICYIYDETFSTWARISVFSNDKKEDFIEDAISNMKGIGCEEDRKINRKRKELAEFFNSLLDQSCERDGTEEKMFLAESDKFVITITGKYINTHNYVRD